jgi:predicted small secreted protein
MRRTIGLLLASAGLAFLVAGCANQTAGAGAPAGGQAAQGGAATASSGDSSMRDFNLRVKCPGVHELKMHGWSDAQIMQQLAVSQEDIPACEQWVASQPKGYVPPPPPGVAAPKTGAAPAAAPSPAK